MCQTTSGNARTEGCHPLLSSGLTMSLTLQDASHLCSAVAEAHQMRHDLSGSLVWLCREEEKEAVTKLEECSRVGFQEDGLDRWGNLCLHPF